MAFIQDQNQLALRRQALIDAAEKNIGGAIDKYADYRQKEIDKQAALDLMARKRAMELEDEQVKREFDLGKQQAEFGFKAEQEKLNRENELKKARIAAQGRGGVDGKKANTQDFKIKERAVPGFDFYDIENIVPSPDDAKTVKDIKVASDTIEQSGLKLAQKLRNLKNTTFGRLDPRTSSELETDLNSLVVAGKEVDRLGALAGPDLGIELGQIGNVLGMKSIISQSPEKAAEMIENFIRTSKNKVDLNANARGYKPTAINQQKTNVLKVPVSQEDIKSMSDEELKAFIGQ